MKLVFSSPLTGFEGALALPLLGVLRRLAYHSLVYGLTTVLGRLLNWLLTPLYAYRLPPEEFGRLNELYAYIVFGSILASLGMETAYFRFSKDAPGVFRRAFGVSLGIGSLVAFLVGGSLPLWSEEVGYAGREGLVWYAVAIWSVDAWAALALAHQRAIGRPFRYAVIQLVHVVLLLALNLYGVGWRGYGIGFILGANLFASLLKLFWALVWAPLREKPLEATPTFGALLRYGAVLAGIGLLGATNDVLDRVLLAQYDRVQTALYGTAYKVATLLALFVQAYRQAADPLFLREAAGDTRLYACSWEAFHWVGLAGVLLLGLWAQPLLTTRWLGLLPAPLLPPFYWSSLGVVPILLFANLFMGSLVQASMWYKLRERPDAGLGITALGSLITVVGNVWGIPRYGYWACAWVTLLAYGVMVLVSVLIGRRRLKGAFPLTRVGGGIALVGLLVFLGSNGTFLERLIYSTGGLGVLGFIAVRHLRR